MSAYLRHAAYIPPFLEALDSIWHQTLPPQRVCIALHGEARTDARVTARLRLLQEQMHATTKVVVFMSTVDMIQVVAYKHIAQHAYDASGPPLPPATYVTFLDADDLYTRDRLEVLQRVLDALPRPLDAPEPLLMSLANCFTSAELLDPLNGADVGKIRGRRNECDDQRFTVCSVGDVQTFHVSRGGADHWNCGVADTATLCAPASSWLRCIGAVDTCSLFCDVEWTLCMLCAHGGATVVCDGLYLYRRWSGATMMGGALWDGAGTACLPTASSVM
jgi:hypothetical protein